MVVLLGARDLRGRGGALRPGGRVRRRRRVRRDPGPALDLRPARHGALDAAAADLQRARAPGPARRAPGLGGARRRGRGWAAGRLRGQLLLLVLAVDVVLLVALLAVAWCHQAAAAGAASGGHARPASVGSGVPAAPVPTDTSRATVSSAAEAICSRTSASSASRSPSATSKTSSSWTWSSIREPSACSRSARSTLSIATLMMSAAEPWIGALSAIRSAISRRCRLSLVRSGR